MVDPVDYGYSGLFCGWELDWYYLTEKLVWVSDYCYELYGYYPNMLLWIILSLMMMFYPFMLIMWLLASVDYLLPPYVVGNYCA